MRRMKVGIKMYYIWVKVDDLNENKLWRVFLRSSNEKDVTVELARCVKSWGEMNTLLMETIPFESSSEVSVVLGGVKGKAITQNLCIPPSKKKKPTWTKIVEFFSWKK